MELLQQNIRWVNSEKDDLESLKNKLSNILLGESIQEGTESVTEQEQKVEEQN